MNSLVITSRAVTDIENLREFYESAQVGLGADFLVLLNATFERILENPATFQYLLTADDGVRRGIVPRFHTIILYQVFNLEIEVLRIKHPRSN